MITKVNNTNAFLLLFSLLTMTIHSQSLEKEYDIIATEIFKPNHPGGVVLISKKGNVTYKKAFGLANMELEVPMKTDMVFEIGSLTKQFTAVAILQLMEQGKLSLNDPITKYIPDYPVYERTITIHHLLTHTAGLQNYTSQDKWTSMWRMEKTLLETIDLFKNEPLDFTTGSKFNYSNAGYVLLGYIIEKVSGLSYNAYLDKNVIQAAGMKNTFCGTHSAIVKNRASGYQINSNYINAEFLSFSQIHAAGALMSTVDDLYVWNKALRNSTLLKKETLKLAETNYKTSNGAPINYGYGWFLNELYGSPTVEHGGGIFGYITYALYLPKEDIYVVVLTNCDSYNPESIAVKLAATALNKVTSTTRLTDLDSKKAARYVGSYKFEDTMVRNIIFENNVLYSQLAGGTKIRLIPIAENEFAYEGIVDAKIRFEDKKEQVTAYLINRMIVKKGEKVAVGTSLPKEISLTASEVERYVGDYKIAPNIVFQISVEGQHLFLQFPGQPKIEFFATSENLFFTKIADVMLEFTKDNNNTIISVAIKQSGQVTIAQKV